MMRDYILQTGEGQRVMISKARGRSKRLLENVHPNAPKRLVREYKKLGCNQLALANKLEVNDFYINRLLKDGVEPSNPEIRVKLFLPRKRVKHKTGEPKYDRPAWLYKWYRLPVSERHDVMKSHLDEDITRERPQWKG